LIRLKANESSSLYREEKATILSSIGTKIEDRDVELNSWMSSLNMDSLLSLDSTGVERLPTGIVDRCAELSAKPDAIPNLAESCAEVEIKINPQDEIVEGIPDKSNEETPNSPEKTDYQIPEESPASPEKPQEEESVAEPLTTDVVDAKEKQKETVGGFGKFRIRICSIDESMPISCKSTDMSIFHKWQKSARLFKKSFEFGGAKGQSLLEDKEDRDAEEIVEDQDPEETTASPEKAQIEPQLNQEENVEVSFLIYEIFNKIKCSNPQNIKSW
jgi:hypothetical protein